MPKRYPHGHSCTPSQIAKLRECPEAYRLSVVDKDERRYESNTFSRIGNLVHDAIDHVTHDRRRRGVVGKVPAKELHAALEREGVDDKQILEARTDPEAVERARELLSSCAASLRLDHAIATEEPFTLNCHGVVVGGILDRVDSGASSALRCVTVTDYKSYAEPKSSSDLRYDPACAVYLAAAKERWPEHHVRAAYHYLSRDVIATVDWTPQLDQWARAVVRDHDAAVKRLKQTVGTSKPWPTKTGKHCSTCSFRFTCKGYERWIKSHGRPDLDKPEDLTQTVERFVEAAEAKKVWEERKSDLGALLEGYLRGKSEVFAAGYRVQFAKRRNPKFGDPEWVFQKVAELTGVPAETVRSRIADVNKTKLSEFLSELPIDKERLKQIEDEVEALTTYTVSVWPEAKALPDRFTAPDVAEKPARGLCARDTQPAIPTEEESCRSTKTPAPTDASPKSSPALGS